MKRTIFQILLLLILGIFFISGFMFVNHILNLPFGPANEALHRNGAAFTLDILIPAGVYIDNTMTIGDVIKIRTSRQASLSESLLRSVADLIPEQYRHIANLAVFIFWAFLFMTFLRVFTFTGYGRALRVSLLMGGLMYYFLPDFSPGRVDDAVFIGFALFIILLRAFIARRIKNRKRLVARHTGSKFTL
ncbi:MAG: hypothetical protein JXA35_06500 [Deltaproteobacteria bacterium]|nr:hypothetical protein [Deltaproteobacteria bacterium]